MKRIIRTDLRRAVGILPGFYVTAAIFIALAGAILFYAHFFIFSKNIFSGLSVAYYVDAEDSDSQFQIGLVEQMDSVKESAKLVGVKSEAEGISLVEQGTVTALIVFPPDFMSLTGTVPIRLYFKEIKTIEEHLVNDIVSIVTDLYSTDRNAASSYTLVAQQYGADGDEVADRRFNMELELFTGVFAKTDTYEIEKIDSVNAYTLRQNLTGSLMLLVFFLLSFQLTVYYRQQNRAYKLTLAMQGIHAGKRGFSQVLGGSALLYGVFLLEFVLLLLFRQHPSFLALVAVLPVIFLVALIVYVLSELITNENVVNLAVFLASSLLIYLAGGFMPTVLMPEFMRSFVKVNPFSYLITYLIHALYG